MGSIGVWAPFVFHLSRQPRCGGGEGKAAKSNGCVWGSPFMARAFIHFEPPHAWPPTQAHQSVEAQLASLCRVVEPQAGLGRHGASAPCPTSVGAACGG